MLGLYAIGFVMMLLGMLVQWKLKSKFTEYSQVGLSNGLSGKEIAQRMLSDNGIYDVKVTAVDGQLTDHYNPADKTVNLSQDVFYGKSVAATAVAAHECGHAVQHATAYSALQMRSAMVPAVSFCSNILNWANMAMIMMGGYIYNSTGTISTTILGILVLANMGVTAFALITLPVEFDASRRALAWIANRNIANNQEYGMAKDALKWAALTYVVGAIGALANLAYYVSMFLGRRSDD